MIELDKNRIPTHIAITMDGNGRWAKAHGLPRLSGHAKGVDVVRKITAECVRLGVKYLTLYTFSTENWNRPAEEVAGLMQLTLDNIEDEIFMKNDVRFRAIGDLERLPDEVRRGVYGLMERTKDNKRMTVNIALSYSSRWEITKAVQDIVREGLQPADITEETISNHLVTNFMPDPDLLIRTGGEFRISNYLLWQVAYSELYFCDTFWPDFDEVCLHRAIADFQNRERRYGKTSEQVVESAQPHPEGE